MMTRDELAIEQNASIFRAFTCKRKTYKSLLTNFYCPIIEIT